MQRILPDLRIDHIEYLELQKAIKPDADAKSIRLDVYIKDSKIEETVTILKNLGVPQQTILANIQEQYHLSPEAAKKYL